MPARHESIKRRSDRHERVRKYRAGGRSSAASRNSTRSWASEASRGRAAVPPRRRAGIQGQGPRRRAAIRPRRRIPIRRISRIRGRASPCGFGSLAGGRWRSPSSSHLPLRDAAPRQARARSSGSTTTTISPRRSSSCTLGSPSAPSTATSTSRCGRGTSRIPFSHKLTLVKAGLAALFINHELKLALADARASPTLSKLVAPITALQARIARCATGRRTRRPSARTTARSARSSTPRLGPASRSPSSRRHTSSPRGLGTLALRVPSLSSYTSARNADLRVPVRAGPHVRGHAAHVRRPGLDLRDLLGPRPARLSSGRRALQGLGLLQHRLRHPQARSGEERELLVLAPPTAPPPSSDSTSKSSDSKPSSRRRTLPSRAPRPPRTSASRVGGVAPRPSAGLAAPAAAD